jgi:acyl carrier protein
MSLTESTAAAELLGFLRTRVATDAPITSETNLARDLALDSLAAMDLLMDLETRFDVTIPINTLPNVETVGDLADLIARAQRGTLQV